MNTPQGGKRFVALSAAVALGLGSAMIAGPAMATTDSKDLSKVAAEVLSGADQVSAIGHNADGEVVVEVVGQSPEAADDAEVSEALESAQAFAKSTTGKDLVVEYVAEPYKALTGTETDAAEDEEAAEYKADDEIVAGAGYFADRGDGSGMGGMCSVGFPATNSSGDDVLITAGHCDAAGDKDVYVERPSTSEAITGTMETAQIDQTRKLGTFTHSQFGPTTDEEVEDNSDLNPESMQDFGVITVDPASGFETVGEVATWSEDSAKADDLASETTPISGIHDVTGGDDGAEIFHSGRTTGKTSGKIGGIIDGYAAIEGHDGTSYMVYGFESNTTVLPGDSGGAVMMGDKAVGVVSGGRDASGDMPAFLWTAELEEGLKHLPGDLEIKTTESDDDETEAPKPTPTETKDPTKEPSEKPTTEAPDEDPALTVDPQEIAAERFIAEDEDQAVEEDRGVTYTVTDVEPGSEVTFDTYTGAGDAANAGTEAAPEGETADEPAKSITVTADENGTASSRVWGLPTADASAYVGDYDVVVTTEDETLEGDFSVVEGGDNGNGGEDDGEELPRTGSTTGPLVAGAAGLVALGGALVYVARRRQA